MSTRITRMLPTAVVLTLAACGLSPPSPPAQDQLTTKIVRVLPLPSHSKVIVLESDRPSASPSIEGTGLVVTASSADFGTPFIEWADVKNGGYTVTNKNGRDLYVRATVSNEGRVRVHLAFNVIKSAVSGYLVQTRTDNGWSDTDVGWNMFFDRVNVIEPGQILVALLAVPLTNCEFRFGIKYFTDDEEIAKVAWTDAMKVIED